MSIFKIEPDDPVAKKRSEKDRLKSDFDTMVALAAPLYDDIPAPVKATAVTALGSIAAFSGETVDNRINTLATEVQLLAVALDYALKEIEMLKNGSGGN